MTLSTINAFEIRINLYEQEILIEQRFKNYLRDWTFFLELSFRIISHVKISKALVIVESIGNTNYVRDQTLSNTPPAFGSSN